MFDKQIGKQMFDYIGGCSKWQGKARIICFRAVNEMRLLQGEPENGRRVLK